MINVKTRYSHGAYPCIQVKYLEVGRVDRTEFWKEESRVRENSHGAANIRHAASFPVSHNLVVTYRLLETG